MLKQQICGNLLEMESWWYLMSYVKSEEEESQKEWRKYMVMEWRREERYSKEERSIQNVFQNWKNLEEDKVYYRKMRNQTKKVIAKVMKKEAWKRNGRITGETKQDFQIRKTNGKGWKRCWRRKMN